MGREPSFGTWSTQAKHLLALLPWNAPETVRPRSTLKSLCCPSFRVITGLKVESLLRLVTHSLGSTVRKSVPGAGVYLNNSVLT